MGRLPRSAQGEPFDQLTVEQRLVETVVHGQFAGSPALVRLLIRLEALGLRVVSFRRMPADEPERKSIDERMPARTTGRWALSGAPPSRS